MQLCALSANTPMDERDALGLLVFGASVGSEERY